MEEILEIYSRTKKIDDGVFEDLLGTYYGLKELEYSAPFVDRDKDELTNDELYFFARTATQWDHEESCTWDSATKELPNKCTCSVRHIRLFLMLQRIAYEANIPYVKIIKSTVSSEEWIEFTKVYAQFANHGIKSMCMGN